MYLPTWPDPQNHQQINLGLDRIKLLLARLNNPHHHLPYVIHVAGTNGKGSTIAFLKSIFSVAGYKVDRYISPHLVEFNERIEIAGKIIDDQTLQHYLDQSQKACEQKPEIPITFFEGTTASAFLAFSQSNSDVLLLETGLGGEFDATNVIDQPLSSIITTIDYDHQEYLGNSIEEIAWAKAGIIKKNCPVITTNQSPKVFEVISNQAKKLNAKLINCYDLDFDFTNLELGLNGQHQLENARLAVSCVLSQNHFKFSTSQIIDGLKSAQWQGRLQKIIDNNLLKLFPQNSQFYLDGSHNLQGARTVKNFLEKFDGKKITLIFSILKDKDCFGFLQEISSSKHFQIDKIIFCEIPNQSRAIKYQEFKLIADRLNLDSQNCIDLKDAILHASYQSNQINIITGSLYLVAEFLKIRF